MNMNNTPVQSPGSLIEKEEKGYQVEEKDKFDQEDVGSHHGNNTPVQSPGSLIEKKEKGYQVEEKDKFDQEEDGSHHLHTTSISDRESVLSSDEKEYSSDLQEEDVMVLEHSVEPLNGEAVADGADEKENAADLQKEGVMVLEHSVEPFSGRAVADGGCISNILCNGSNGRYILRYDGIRNDGIRNGSIIYECINDDGSIRSIVIYEFLRSISTAPQEAEWNHRLAARKQTMHLLKHYSLLKEELNWPDIITIADNLYTDGYLQWHELVKIRNRSQPRRKAIDILLKVVLGNESSVSTFMKIMESKSTLSYIAERINMTQISAEEMERFRHLEGILQGQRQNIYQVTSQKIQSSDSDFSFLLRHSYEKDVIDQMGDFLLSNFFISISDHTGIVEQTHLDGKILKLIGLMKKCPDDVYDVLVEGLTKKNMQCVLECLERNQMPNMKRKHWSTGKLHLNILNQCLQGLVRNLDVKTVCMYIQQKEVLDDVTVRDILEQKTISEKIRELIKQIQERDLDTYEKFKECLVQAKQEFLKVMLEEEEAKLAKEIEDHDMPTLQKRAKIEKSGLDAVEKIAHGLRIAPVRQKLGNKASKHLDLELKESFWGSMGLMFSFKVGRPSQKLKQAFA